MGSRLVRRLLAEGHAVRALVLPKDPFLARLDGCDCELVTGDITESQSLRGLAAGVDTIYHLAAVILSSDPAVFEKVNVQGTRNLLALAAGAKVQHFIYVSSASVVYPQTTPYSRSKRECERLVRQQDQLAYTLVRPTLVYESDGGMEFQLFLRYLMKFPVVPFIGRGQARKSPVYAEDVIDGLVKLAGCQKAHGRTYNFCGAESLPIWDLAKLMLARQGSRKVLVPVPVWFCRLAAALMKRLSDDPPLTHSAIAGIVQDADLDPSSARMDLAYAPIGVHDGLDRCFPPAAS